MARLYSEKLTRGIQYPDGRPVPVVYPTGIRSTVTASTSSTNETLLPAGAVLVLVRATVSIWLRLGTTGMAAAAPDDNSVLFPAGESVIPTQAADGTAYTHYRVLLATGTTSCPVQLEAVI